MECPGISHLLHRIVKSRDDSRRQRLRHISDTQTDNLAIRMFRLIGIHFFCYRGKQIAPRQFQIIFVDFKHDDSSSYSSISPSNTTVAGPVMYTWPSFSSQPILRSPPRRLTVTSLWVRPFTTHATATAQAPVPQASVSPEPRSQTLIRTWLRLSSWTNSVLILSGKRTWFSKDGPIFSISRLSISSRNTTPWGFPMDTPVIR